MVDFKILKSTIQIQQIHNILSVLHVYEMLRVIRESFPFIRGSFA